VRDLEEPRRLQLRHDAALDAAERVEEGALDRVLGLLARAELVQAVAEDLVRVLLVERPREVRFGSRRSFDPDCTTYGRYCGHISSSPETAHRRAPPEHAKSHILGEVARSDNPL